MMANGGKRRSLAQFMRDAGYSESYARNPQKIKQTKAWRAETADFFDNKELAANLKALLGSYKLQSRAFPLSLEDKDIIELFTSMDCIVKKIDRGERVARVWYWTADNGVRAQALDMIFRIQGAYRGERKQNNPLEELTDNQLMKEIQKAKAGV
jgi:hypothetical protein